VDGVITIPGRSDHDAWNTHQVAPVVGQVHSLFETFVAQGLEGVMTKPAGWRLRRGKPGPV